MAGKKKKDEEKKVIEKAEKRVAKKESFADIFTAAFKPTHERVNARKEKVRAEKRKIRQGK